MILLARTTHEGDLTQESIRTLTPKPLAWTNVLGTGAARG